MITGQKCRNIKCICLTITFQFNVFFNSQTEKNE